MAGELRLEAIGLGVVRGRARAAAGAPVPVVLLLGGVVAAHAMVDEAVRDAPNAGWRDFSLAVPPGCLGRMAAVRVGDGEALFLGPVRAEWLAEWRDVACADGRLRGQIVARGLSLDGLLAEVWDGDTRVGAALLAPMPVLPEEHRAGIACWELSVPLSVAVAAGQVRELLVSVSVRGDVLRTACALPAEAAPLVGHLDHRRGDAIVGWLLDRRDPGRPVAVEARVAGVGVAWAVAGEERPDLAQAGLATVAHGFRLALPDDARASSAEVVVCGTDLCLGTIEAEAARPEVLGAFDALSGARASGWAWAPGGAEPLVVEILDRGKMVASGPATLFRKDVHDAGYGSGHAGFEIEVPADALADPEARFDARVRGRDALLDGSGRASDLQGVVRRWLRGREPSLAARARLGAQLDRQTAGGRLSILMPVFNSRLDWLEEAIASVRAQWCSRWELICADDGSTDRRVGALIRRHARADRRIRLVRARRNGGIARATNLALGEATGTHVLFLDHDDALEPGAVGHLLRAAAETGAGLIYGDEVITGADIRVPMALRARPAWSRDYYLSHPYFVHPVCVEAGLARALGGLDEAMLVSADVDFVLRATSRLAREGGQVAHVPRVLYRWRTHGGSAGHAAHHRVMAATGGAIARVLRDEGEAATVSPGPGFNLFRIERPAPKGGRTLAVIPTRNRTELLDALLASLERTADMDALRVCVVDHASDEPEARAALARIKAAGHRVLRYEGRFNYARMNNLAVRAHGGGCDTLLFLNNDVEAVELGWLPRLRALALRPDVGMVGPQLLYPDGRVQHGGVIVGFGGVADHAHRFQPATMPDGSRNIGYNAGLAALRDASAVTGACMMTRAEVFAAVGGFDEGFAVGYNDTDLCLRIGQAGWRVLYDGMTVLTHRESVSRAASGDLRHPEDTARFVARWGTLIAEGDPCYSPLLSLTGTDHVLAEAPRCGAPVRAVAAGLRPPPLRFLEAAE